jgi:hypothetical protein
MITSIKCRVQPLNNPLEIHFIYSSNEKNYCNFKTRHKTFVYFTQNGVCLKTLASSVQTVLTFLKKKLALTFKFQSGRLKVKNKWSFTSTRPVRFHGMDMEKHQFFMGQDL